MEKNKDRQDSFEIDRNETLKEDIKRLNESSKRTSNWSDKIDYLGDITVANNLKISYVSQNTNYLKELLINN